MRIFSEKTTLHKPSSQRQQRLVQVFCSIFSSKDATCAASRINNGKYVLIFRQLPTSLLEGLV